MTAGFTKLVKDMEEDGMEGQSYLEIVYCMPAICGDFGLYDKVDAAR